VKRGLLFAGLAAVIIFGGAWGITALKPGAEMARAVWSSAVIAFVVQIVSFAVARPFVATNPIAGWGLGSLVRFAVVMVHAFVGIPALGLASGPALISLVGFLFVTMIVEPLFLQT
jgi:hypothetical protein